MKLICLWLLCSIALATPSKSIILKSAQASTAAYHESPQIGLRFIAEHTDSIFGNRLLAFFDSQQNTLYIAVRGSTAIGNWISNLHVATSNSFLDQLITWSIPDDYEQYYDHAKKIPKAWFLEAFQDLQQATGNILSRHAYDRVVFTGHSYGGLMANLLAQDAYQRYLKLRIICHTFNAPGAQEIRASSLELPALDAQILNKHFMNHVRSTDLVGSVNTHEGKVLQYPAAARFETLTDEHAMHHFEEDLLKGMLPLG